MKYLRLLNVILFTALLTAKISVKEIDFSFYFFLVFLIFNTIKVVGDLTWSDK